MNTPVADVAHRYGVPETVTAAVIDGDDVVPREFAITMKADEASGLWIRARDERLTDRFR